MLNALCATGSIFSTHPELYTEKYGNPRRAALYFCKKAEEGLQANPRESIELVQALIVLAMFDYSHRNAGRSHLVSRTTG